MAPKEIKDVEASILQRLKNYSEAKREDRNLTLCNYAIERFLYRLSLSQYASQFVLKGAQLFRLWQGFAYRATRDLDLHRNGDPDLEALKRIVSDICQIETDVLDGIRFLPGTIKAEVIREDNVYDGVRIRVEYRIGKTGQFMQIDIGFGDAIFPASANTEFPRILDMPAITVMSYRPESVIAEKVEAMVTLGIANSRMKDFFDVFALSQTFAFDGIRLAEAVRATFDGRHTVVPRTVPLAMTGEFAEDPVKASQWHAFLRKHVLKSSLYEFERVIKQIEEFIMPVFKAVDKGTQLQNHWNPGGPWSKSDK